MIIRSFINDIQARLLEPSLGISFLKHVKPFINLPAHQRSSSLIFVPFYFPYFIFLLGWLPPPRRENLAQIYENLLTLRALDRPRILRMLKIVSFGIPHNLLLLLLLSLLIFHQLLLISSKLLLIIIKNPIGEFMDSIITNPFCLLVMFLC